MQNFAANKWKVFHVTEDRFLLTNISYRFLKDLNVIGSVFLRTWNPHTDIYGGNSMVAVMATRKIPNIRYWKTGFTAKGSDWIESTL